MSASSHRASPASGAISIGKRQESDYQCTAAPHRVHAPCAYAIHMRCRVRVMAAAHLRRSSTL
eukprot:627323-Prymnesium_polylepis.1